MRGLVACGLVAASFAFAQSPSQNKRDIFTKKLAPFVSSPTRIVDRMLEMAAIKPTDTVFDLGCGDGRILFQAAQKYSAKAVGIEIDDKLVQMTNEKIVNLGLQNRVKVQQGNLLEADLSNADVVTIYLLTQSNEVLRPRLEKMLRPGTRVVSYDYAVPGWKPKKIDRTAESNSGGHVIYLYEMPPEKQ
jgi:protein-L-isoaspartate O-methyltransferase